MTKPTARPEEDATARTYTRRVGEWAGVVMEVWTPVRDDLATSDYEARLNHARDTIAAQIIHDMEAVHERDDPLEDSPLIANIAVLIGVTYAYAVHKIRCHPRYVVLIQHAWSLVVIGNGMVALFAGWVLSSWLVF